MIARATLCCKRSSAERWQAPLVSADMVALVALASALEPFFNRRSRWVLMEETQYWLNQHPK